MQPVDVSGIVYSSGGLRFGVPTEKFLEETDELEYMRPGVRSEIIGEAHYLSRWSHKFPDVAFLITLLIWESVPLALAGFATAYVVETLRFYAFGPSRTISRMCDVWHWLAVPLFIGGAVFLWSEERFLSVVLIVYLLIQGLAFILSRLAMILFRYPWSKVLDVMLGNRDPSYHFLEARSLLMVIDRWRKRLTASPSAL